MAVCLYLRGSPGTGKNTVARLLERDLKWPRLWVHHLDSLYRAIGEYRLPTLTNDILELAAAYMMSQQKDFMFVRPSRESRSVQSIAMRAMGYDYTFVPVRLTASYQNLVTRVTRRWAESPFRLTTKEALDEYLESRPEQPYAGETVIDTDALSPEQVAGRIKELLPCVPKCLRSTTGPSVSETGSSSSVTGSL